MSRQWSKFEDKPVKWLCGLGSTAKPEVTATGLRVPFRGCQSSGLGQGGAACFQWRRSPWKPRPLQAVTHLPPSQDWYLRLVKSQCWTRSDSALLEGAELVNRIPAGDMSAFMLNSVRGTQRAGCSGRGLPPLLLCRCA